ncbi:adenosylcobinamide kinase/adenosylcobinamide phosphate guanyltransferase [Rubrobacter xylanophilus]|uniref:Adenosylcobinamide kinase n=1 Tax=Rubrobacter xylanophilus TaxID=49319 RepID=A0A510HQA7_9ACTN|nr:adenosylcobinamide kinase/adenosylcobinamide phosphate guanyltransferase [Rubrobacter xylanophilus]
MLYVATAEAADDEMRRRIEEHRRRRPPAWETLEVRRGVGSRLWALGGAPPVVLLDCLSLLVSNALLDEAARRGEGPGLEDAAARAVEQELSDLLDWHEGTGRHLVVVSNEVGWGVVPPSRLGRIYRDLLGSANQRIAARARRAVLMVAGLPLELKRT